MSDISSKYEVVNYDEQDSSNTHALCHNSLYRTVFNATFYRSVGFVTKRAAEAMILLFPDVQDVCRKAIDAIVSIVDNERKRVHAYLCTKHKLDINKANCRDIKLSNELKEARIRGYVENAVCQQNHFEEIKRICMSDPRNPVSKRVMLYMESNGLMLKK